MIIQRRRTMAWELAKVENQRKELVNLYYKSHLSMSDICKRFGISRKTGYKWIRRFEVDGDLGLLDLPRTPIQPNRTYSEKQIEMAIDFKCKHLKWGPKKILATMKMQFPDQQWPSNTRLYEIFKEQGLTTKRRYRRKIPATHPLGDVTGANDVWMADFKGWFRTGDRSKCEPFTITDGYSRFVIRCIHLKKKDVESVWAVMDEAFREFGLPLRIRTDNGPPFGSIGSGRLTKLSVNLIKAGVLPEWIEPGHPEQNGRHERFHLTLKEEIANPPAKNLSFQLRKMREFVEEFNFDRPHEALSMLTPSDCYTRSQRSWDGVLRSPEYNLSEGKVRKVSAGGTIRVNQYEVYIGQALSGEYILLKEGAQEGDDVFYGNVFLGKFIQGKGLYKP